MGKHDELFSPSPPWFLRVVTDLSTLTDMAWRLQSSDGKQHVVRIVRGSRMRTFKPMFDELSAALQFPSYCGDNFNALSECLTDLEWMPGDAYVLIVSDAPEVLSSEQEADRIALLHLLRDAAAEWSRPVRAGEAWDRPAIPFHILLHSKPEDASSLDRLVKSAGVEAPLMSVDDQQ